MTRNTFALAALLAAGGCAADVRDIGREPHMTPVGRGLVATTAPIPVATFAHAAPPSRGSLWSEGRGDLYRDQRVMKVGDILTVNIAINDRASFGNTNGRTNEAKVKGSFNLAASLFGYGADGDATVGVESTSSSKGQGVIDRSEKIQLSIAAVVTDVLPNGNLLISGSQEIRVNYELRNLEIAGIVRPHDISRENTIAYDRIAEARVSYGGRGRIMEAQQPGWGHQVYDLAKPF
jgi:flagellar L-ring protein FlgH